MPDSSTVHAVGPVANAVRRSIEEAFETSYDIECQRQAEMTVALFEACAHAQETGWDGYSGEGVRIGAYVTAEAFLRVLPRYLPAPEISVHPDGQVAFDWTADRGHVFAISVGDDDLISYAGLFGGSKVTGREVFSGTFPAGILPHILRIAALM